MQSSTAEKPLSPDEKEHIYQVLCLEAAVLAIILVAALADLLVSNSVSVAAGLLIAGISGLLADASLWFRIGWKYRKYPDKSLYDQPVPDLLRYLMPCVGGLGTGVLIAGLMAATILS